MCTQLCDLTGIKKKQLKPISIFIDNNIELGNIERKMRSQVVWLASLTRGSEWRKRDFLSFYHPSDVCQIPIDHNWKGKREQKKQFVSILKRVDTLNTF